MGYAATVTHEPTSGTWAVSVRVTLTRAESTDLFLSGDSMVSWPTEGIATSNSADPRLERSGMFVSEMASRPTGLCIRYGSQDEAERAAKLFRIQFAQIGIQEET